MSELRRRLVEIIDDPGSGIDDADPAVRRLAVSLAGGRAIASALLGDPDASVRAAAAEALAGSGDAAPLLAATGDEAAVVREAIAFALGEVGDIVAVEWLMDASANDDNEATREAAVAALGAIEAGSALPLLIELAASAPPKVRRRAVVALSAFDDPSAEEAITRAALDRNPMVREVAEMVVGPAPEDLPFPRKSD